MSSSSSAAEAWQFQRESVLLARARTDDQLISRAYTVKRSGVLTDFSLGYMLDVDTLNLTAILSRGVDRDHIKAMGTLNDEKPLKPMDRLVSEFT